MSPGPELDLYATLAAGSIGCATVEARADMLRILNLRAPLLLATPDDQRLSVIAPSAKNRGYYQRTLFTRGEGPSTDSQHLTLELAVVAAWDMGFVVVTERRRLPVFMRAKPC